MGRSTLSGAWSGAYRYPGDAYPETVFEADIVEMDGAFSGATREPNTQQLGADSVVTATLEGQRRGAHVSFVKFMDGSGGMNHAVRYEGLADADLSHIEGRWSIRGDWSGSFFMTRSDAGAEEAVSVEAEATINIRR